MSKLGKLGVEELVDRFRAYALQQETALLDSDTGEFNRLFDKMKEIDAELRARGQEARKALVPLLDDGNMRVRYAAAAKLLAVAPERALTTLKDIAASYKMPEAGEAGMALDLLGQGIFKPT